MALIDYFDRHKTTVAILRDWRDQEWKMIKDADKIRALNAKMTAVGSASADRIPLKGGGSRQEERLCAAIDRKTIAENGLRRAQEYLDEITPAWERLSDEERYLLEKRYIDHGEGNGIRDIMKEYHIQKTEAYDRCSRALDHLSRLLFW